MINTMRHSPVFSPENFGQRPVEVIGAGATGSRVVYELAKKGVQNIRVWDFDTIESHNIANQFYGLEDIGRLKVEALQERVLRDTGTNITIQTQRVDGSQYLGSIVFLLTDTMASRKEIWDKAIKFKLGSNLMIETRMGIDEGRIYSVNPCKPTHVYAWEKTLYEDKPEQVSACGSSITVGATADVLAGFAVWQMIRWFSILQGENDVLDNEIIYSLRPPMLATRRFR